MTSAPLLRFVALAAMALGAWGQVTVAIQPLSAQATAEEEESLRSLTERLQDRLAQEVVKLPNVSLLDRQHIGDLLREQDFAVPASVDRAAADKIGRMLRVDVMLLVSFYPLQNSGMFSVFAGGKRWTASADAVEVATGRIVSKPVCSGIEKEGEILACAKQIAREVQPSIALLWGSKEQQAKIQAEAQNAAATRRQKDEDERRVAAQQSAQAMRVEELRHAEALQRERTEEERLRLQRIQEEKVQQEAQARLDAELERVKTRFSDLASEANAMLDYWARMEQELRRQGGGAMRSEIRSAAARLRSDMDAADDCLKRGLLNEALSGMEKARKEIGALEQMK